MNQNVASETVDSNRVRLQCLYLSLLRVMKNVGVAWSVSSCRILNLKKIWCVFMTQFLLVAYQFEWLPCLALCSGRPAALLLCLHGDNCGFNICDRTRSLYHHQ